jgi:hypothetical protein
MRLADVARFERGSVVWFHRVFGAALLANVATEASAGVWHVHAGRFYPWRHLPIVPLYPPAALAVEWLVAASAGVALVVGARRAIAIRVAAAVTLVGLSQRYSNHGALLFLVALFVSLAPPDLDADFEARVHPNLALVRAQLAIVYVFSALNKLARPFASGAALVHLLGVSPSYATALAWLVIAAELGLPVVLAVRPRVGVVGVAALHASFAAFMPGLWSFGLAMVAMAVLFTPPPAAASASTAP